MTAHGTSRGSAARRRSPRPLAGIALVMTVVALISGCARPGQHTASWRTDAEPSPRPAPAAADTATANPKAPQPVPDKVLLGSYLNLAGMDQQQAYALRRQQLGRDPRIVHRYYAWNDPLPQTAPDLPTDSILLISWDGMPYSAINSGSQDAVIARAADALARYGHPVFLRWAWEMNGNWYTWGGARNGNDPAGFITAWRHLHDIFAAHHAANVAWVWGPNCYSLPETPWNDMTSYYPGDAYVDWVAVSGYFASRETPDYLFGPVVRNYSAKKPIMIAETGALEKGGTVKADWIDQLAVYVTAHPAIGAVVWFDTDNDHGNGKNWRIDSTPGSLAAYRRLAGSPRFAG
ncbi:MAG: glycoside hydrolase family protein [Dactylosporangium sp.]|nr:glycoside hydrolase family protein [Dactylosporangium sp.]